MHPGARRCRLRSSRLIHRGCSLRSSTAPCAPGASPAIIDRLVDSRALTRFDLDADYRSRFKLRQVGARQHQELWVPAEDLDACNNQLLDPIRVDAGFFGNSYVGPEPLPTMLRGKAPTEQLQLLHSIRVSSGMDFACELAANSRVVVANYLFWRGLGPALAGLSAGVASALLDDIRRVRIESGACWPYDPSV